MFFSEGSSPPPGRPLGSGPLGYIIDVCDPNPICLQPLLAVRAPLLSLSGARTAPLDYVRSSSMLEARRFEADPARRPSGLAPVAAVSLALGNEENTDETYMRGKILPFTVMAAWPPLLTACGWGAGPGGRLRWSRRRYAAQSRHDERRVWF